MENVSMIQIGQLFGMNPITLAITGVIVAGVIQFMKRQVENLVGWKILVATAIASLVLGTVLYDSESILIMRSETMPILDWFKLCVGINLAAVTSWELVFRGLNKLKN